jgi:membrane protease YdiL (CAAX protease family)
VETEKILIHQSKRCDYCGCENEPASLFCKGCGTPLPIDALASENARAPAEKQQLNARRATLVLLAHLAGQLLGGMVAGIIGALSSGVRQASMQDPKWFEEIMFSPFAVILIVIGGGVAMLLASYFLIREQLTKTTAVGAAWVPGSRKKIAFGFGVGVLVGMTYLTLAFFLGPKLPSGSHGPLAKMAVTKGISQLLWIVVALFLAPPIEELLFRGVLYGGYRQSFGPIRAAVFTSSIFVLLHVTEINYYWPAIVGITSSAFVAVWLRLRSAAIGPAVAEHFGYNLTIVTCVLLFS